MQNYKNVKKAKKNESESRRTKGRKGKENVHPVQAHTHTHTYQPDVQVFTTYLSDQLITHRHIFFGIVYLLQYIYYYIAKESKRKEMKTKPEKLFFVRYPRNTVKWSNNAQLQICWTLLSIKQRFGGNGHFDIHKYCI